ncbi:hypothetical protein CDO52_08470 [Nocardiopsis gilva YIM 90087]|uniref:DUF8017 domain-containing protein n=2 Tax=Nocardiopsis gilva TaxID=280236 RepID=A0A223S3X5_9ACTN|nr:hypothetical protein [Nocardiopsis gilva]ASU82811.1 hypothetical protein CDO52_08470 [Nocardiopsis gilva YIM 90087]
MLALLAMVMVVAVAIAVVVVWNTLRESPQIAAPEPSPSATAQEVDDEPSAEPSEPSESPDEPEELINSGWRTVKSDKWGFTYEVPPSDDDWAAKGDGFIVGQGEDENGTPEIAMSGVAIYKDQPCDGWGDRAVTGAQGITETQDTAAMAKGVATKWAELSFTTDAGAATTSVRTVEAFSNNGLKGHRAIVDAKLKKPKAGCQPPTAEVHTVVVPNPDEENAVRAFTIVADTGLPDAEDTDVLEKILNSLRDEDYEVE